MTTGVRTTSSTVKLPRDESRPKLILALSLQSVSNTELLSGTDADGRNGEMDSWNDRLGNSRHSNLHLIARHQRCLHRGIHDHFMCGGG